MSTPYQRWAAHADVTLAHLTEAQQAARDRFDLDAAMAQIDLIRPLSLPVRPCRCPTTLPDADLRHYAINSLGAKRFSAGYLQALRGVLGMMANAERGRFKLRLRLEVRYASIQTMRTILAQLRAAGVTRKIRRKNGPDQWVWATYYFPPIVNPDVDAMGWPEDDTEGATAEMERQDRCSEVTPERAASAPVDLTEQDGINEGDVPY